MTKQYFRFQRENVSESKNGTGIMLSTILSLETVLKINFAI